MEQRAPQFLISEERSHRSIRQALASIWETDSPVLSLGIHLTRAWPKDQRSGPGFFTSSLLHFAIVVLLVRLPVAWFLAQPATPKEIHADRVVYMLHSSSLAEYFPVLKPPGPGGKPGQGSRPDRPSARGGTVYHPKLTIISNPPHPDNNRQTILQSTSPPELKIPFELRLPNILIGKVAPLPPAPPPAAPKPFVIPVVKPFSAATVQQPAPELAMVPPRNPLPNPSLPVPLPPAPAPPAPEPPQKTNEAAAPAQAEVQKPQPSGVGLLSLSVEPAPSAESVAIPPGNRQGAFSISPAGGKEGSPGGVPGGDAQGGGTGGKGAGDASTGLGPGNSGGGGGKSTGETSAGPGSATGTGGGGTSGASTPATGNNISISGGTTNGNGDGVLPSFYGAAEVYPVTPPGPRRPSMVVTAGPTGGGGLEVYGILKGGKIYTIYLPMPGKNWILQYCAHDIPSASQDPEPRSVAIRLDPAVVPPAALEQFDFHRPSVPDVPPNRREMLILQGVIWEDGTVGQLKVYKGLLEAVDRAAIAAFGRWKFRPALRSNKPIAVEVLVGIPVVMPST